MGHGKQEIQHSREMQGVSRTLVKGEDTVTKSSQSQQRAWLKGHHALCRAPPVSCLQTYTCTLFKKPNSTERH